MKNHVFFGKLKIEQLCKHMENMKKHEKMKQEIEYYVKNMKI